MKGYSEQRGVLSQIIFDAYSGQFKQRVIPNAFANPPASAEIIELATLTPRHKDTVPSRKSRTTVMPVVQNRRSG